MNYINSIIRILEISPIEFSDNEIQMVKFRAQLPSIENKIGSPFIVESILWGDLAFDLANYYKINDYVLIEGSLSFVFYKIDEQQIICLNIDKLYPFLIFI